MKCTYRETLTTVGDLVILGREGGLHHRGDLVTSSAEKGGCTVSAIERPEQSKMMPHLLRKRHTPSPKPHPSLSPLLCTYT